MYYILLGLIQGLTEFLPVSSSGHLVLSQYLFGIDIPGVAFETFVHFGTVLAVLFLFKKKIKELIAAFLKSLSFILNREKFIKHISGNYQCKFAWLLLLSTIPGAVIGYFFQHTIEQLFSNPVFTAIMLMITGLCLYLTDKFFVHGTKTIREMNRTDAMFIGFAQALAIIPGISRSGFTIMMGISRRLERKFAAEYSFILSIPIILGASIYKISDIFRLNINVPLLIISGFTAFLTGYWAMIFFTRLLLNFKLRFFSIYLWTIGLLVLFLNLSSWK